MKGRFGRRWNGNKQRKRRQKEMVRTRSPAHVNTVVCKIKSQYTCESFVKVQHVPVSTYSTKVGQVTIFPAWVRFAVLDGKILCLPIKSTYSWSTHNAWEGGAQMHLFTTIKIVVQYIFVQCMSHNVLVLISWSISYIPPDSVLLSINAQVREVLYT